jgi:NADP-dependent 3-hydroxy acid dehydrogenase YdfG
MLLKGKVAIISSAGSGIGEAPTDEIAQAVLYL